MAPFRLLLAAAAAAMIGAAPASAAPPSAGVLHARNLAADCTTCHAGPAASDNRLQSLAGWSQADLLAALRAYRASDVRGDVMVQLSKGYTDEQLVQIAAALASRRSEEAP